MNEIEKILFPGLVLHLFMNSVTYLKGQQMKVDLVSNFNHPSQSNGNFYLVPNCDPEPRYHADPNC